MSPSALLGYRIFFYDGANRITNARDFEASDDDVAIRIAETWREGPRMDLWQRDRRVRCWGFDACSLPDCTR